MTPTPHTPSTSQEQLWDAKDAAAFLKVSRSWIYQRAEAGLVPHLKIGALLRFEPSVIRDFARQERCSPSSVAARLVKRG